MPSSALAALLSPRSIAIIGASSHPASRGFHVWRSVRLSTGLENLWPVNPKYRFVDDYPCYKDAASIPFKGFDLAILCVKPQHLPRALGALKSNPPRALLCAPQAEGPIVESDMISSLRAAARSMGSRLLGPNSIGVMSPNLGVNASFWPSMPNAGSVALIAQSAMVATSFMDRAQACGLGLSGAVNSGLEIDVGLAELIEWYAADAATRVIAVEVEALRNPKDFFIALRCATELKPVVVLRAGPGAGFAADRLAASRYGTDAGADDAFDALLRAAGAHRVRSFSHFFAAAAALASGTLPAGRRAAIITLGGGFAGLAADAAASAGIRVEGLSNQTIQTLAEESPDDRIPVNPIVIGTGSPSAKLARTLDLVLEDQGIDGALVVAAPSPTSPLDPAVTELARAAAKTFKPVFVSWISSKADATVRKQLDRLPDSRLIAIRSPDDAAAAFGILADRRSKIDLRRSRPSAGRGYLSPESLARIRLLCLRVLESGRHALVPREVRSLIELLGFKAVEGRLTHTLEEAQAAAREVGWPIALKASSPSIGSRSTAGLMFLNIGCAQTLEKAWSQLTRNWEASSPWAKLDGILVEAMAEHAFERELKLGIRLDAALGPVIEFGGAGLASSLYGDQAVALAPLSLREAELLVRTPKYARTLETYRGLDPVNWNTLSRALCRLSDLAAALPALRELRLEPVVPVEDGLLVLDASASLFDAPLMPERGYPHLAVGCVPFEDREAFCSRSGEKLTLRALTEDDFDAYKDYVENLSEKSFYYRFHAGTRLSDERLALLCRPNWSIGGAWAIVEDRGTIAACGRWARIDGAPEEAEFGIAVADGWHRQGLASRLMQKLEAEVIAEGFHTMVGFVLPGNEPMENLLSARGYVQSANIEGGKISRDARRWACELKPKS